MNIRLFKNKNFFLVIQAKLVSIFGSLMMTFAMSLYVLKQYDSSTLFASVLVIGVIPSIIISPIAGVLVDRYNRKHTLILLDLMSGFAVMVCVLIYSVVGTLPLYAIYGVTIVLSAINTLFIPASGSIIPMLFEKEQLFEANTIDRFVFMVANIAGPLTAGFLMSLENFLVVMIVNSASYFFSAITEIFIQLPPLNHQKGKLTYAAFRTDLTEGFKFFKQKPVLSKLLLIIILTNLATMPITTIAIPYYLKKTLLIPDTIYGGFNAVVVVAMILAMMVSGKIAKHIPLEKIIRINFTTIPVMLFIFCIFTTEGFLGMFDGYPIPLMFSLFIMCITMMIDTIGGIAIDTILQRLIPKAMFGRAITFFATGIRLVAPIGQSFMGYGIDVLPLFVPVLIASFVSGIAGILINIHIHDHMLTNEDTALTYTIL